MYTSTLPLQRRLRSQTGSIWNVLFLLLLSSTFFACQTETEVITISGNQALPDAVVPQVIKENYINKLYIGLLGRKPEDQELSSGLAELAKDNASAENRQALLLDILEEDEFLLRMYEVANTEMLRNLDSSDIKLQIFLYNQALTDPQYAPFVSLIQEEIRKLRALLAVPKDLLASRIDREGMHSRMCQNFYYDEINMGSQNFVLSLFEYFLARYPSTAEEEASIQMVDGFGSVVFGKEGHNKASFVEIFLSSDSYLEGQVTDVYQRFLLRDPTSLEASEGVVTYKQEGSYQALLLEVLSSDEFLGI